MLNCYGSILPSISAAPNVPYISAQSGTVLRLKRRVLLLLRGMTRVGR